MNAPDHASDIRFMRRAAALAKRGLGFVSPNPAVGAVIVREGRILGEGYHRQCGGPHAEIEAIHSLPHPSDAKNATIYVTLEPCSSFGRTPPCCDAIVEAGFARVVFGSTDPNPKHAGRAVELLNQHGIATTSGVLANLCDRINEPFFRWIRSGMPLVTLKLAETLDGKIATLSGDSQWITGSATRKHVQSLRLATDAILAGAETFRLDRPAFTARDAKGNVLRTPRRFIASHRPLILPDDSWQVVRLDSPEAWHAFLAKLGGEQVLSLLIEGGGELAASALHAKIVDRVEFHIAPKILGGRNSRTSVGGPNPARLAEAVELTGIRVRKLGNDFIYTATPLYAKE